MTRAQEGVLDTNVVINLALADPAELPAEPVISTVTLAELAAGPLLASSERVRAVRLAHLQQAESDFEPLPFDAACARAFARVAADVRRTGRKSKARALDALIAATAIAHDLPLYTENTEDFVGIEDLRVEAVSIQRPTS